jgi:hypothetical protein
MDSAYLEALNPGLLRRRECQGELRDPVLLRETARLNRCLREEVAMPAETVAPRPANTTTIQPPHWKASSRTPGTSG